MISSSTVSAPSISAALSVNDNFTETWNVVITDANNVSSNANVIVNFKVTASGVAVVRYIHTDGLGSPVAKSDANGNLIANSRTRYEPYGMTVAGTSIPTIGFTGHVNDADTGLTYMQQRYYDPVAGRFLSEDPVLTDSNTGASFNRYVYANNNPYRYIDPDGRQGVLTIYSKGNNDGSSGSGGLSGHSWIVYAKNGQAPVTYGTWGNNPKGLGNGLHTNLEKGQTARVGRTIKLDSEKEAKLFGVINEYKSKGEDGWTYTEPCSTFAADAWNTSTGENLNPNGPYSNPSTLKESIKKANDPPKAPPKKEEDVLKPSQRAGRE